MSTSSFDVTHSKYQSRGSRLSKRIFDVVFSVCAILALLPVMLLTAICIRLIDGGPVFYVHTRIGKSGVPFPCLKFRTMVSNADERLAIHLAADEEARAEFKRTHKLRNDPRIIPGIGHFLRATSMDELPQFFNVLSGDMSIVGPRPVTAEELDGYAATRRLYESVRPGITGLWQTSGRSDVDFTRRVALDRYYILNWSFGWDLKIIVRTIAVVFARQGAV
jgi:lipopolysaccharide/colanic/teichoic acid biosynthesis glycosyltransferase